MRFRAAAWCVAGFLGSPAALVPVAARAQSGTQETAAARLLFAEGRMLAESGDLEAAADRFRRALALRPAAATRYNLAVVLGRQGHVLEAAELLRTVLREAPANDSARRSAEEHLREFAALIARLTIRLSGGVTGVEVVLDGRPVAAPMLGVAVPVDPGRHAIEVRRRGRVVASREMRAAPGQAAEVELAVPVQTPEGAARAEAAATGSAMGAPAAERGPGTGPGLLPWLVAGGAVLVAAGGGVLVGMAQADVAAVEGAPMGSQWSSVQAAYERAPSLSTIGFAMVGVGAAGLVLGVVMLLSGGDTQETAVALGPGGLLVAGRF